MAEFPVNPTRFDPYKNFKFRIKWDGRYVAGISKVSALKRTTEVVKHRDGGDPSTSRKSPGRTEYDPITLERGVTQDLEFEQWANKVWLLHAGLLYPPLSSPDSLTLFVWGSNRILPVRLLQLQILEQMFDPSLNPIRVEIQVTLLVRADSDFPKNSPFRKYWEDYLKHLQVLAGLFPNGSLSDLGLTGLP